MCHENAVCQQTMDIACLFPEAGRLRQHGFIDPCKGRDEIRDPLKWIYQGLISAFYLFPVMQHNSHFRYAVISSVAAGCFDIDNRVHGLVKLKQHYSVQKPNPTLIENYMVNPMV